VRERAMKKGSPFYDKKYTKKEFYWGKKPSAMCDTIIQKLRYDLIYTIG